jgi:hypothetical protein
MPASRLDLCVGNAILRFSDANDHHHLVMRADDISVDALRLRVDGAAALIVQLPGSARVLRAFALDNVVIWRPALHMRLGSGI